MASIVIKAKYEETLRRFNVAVKNDNRLDLNIEGLRLKIRSLFDLPADSDFSLTYKDEDGDLVTLGDDDDLHDLVRQDLDPVRITVLPRADRNSQSFSTPSRNAAPSIPSPQNVQPNVADVVKSVQETLGHVLLNLNSTTPQQNLNPDVATILNSVKEPLAQAMSKLSSDVSSKATTTSPILADLFDGLSKIGQSCLNAALSGSGATGVNSHNNVGTGSKPNSEGSQCEGSASTSIKNADINSAGVPQSDPKTTQATEVGASVKKPSCSSLPCDKGKKTSCESSSKKKSSSCGIKKGKDTGVSKRGASVSTGFARAMPVNSSEKESYINRMNVGGFPFSGIPLAYNQNFNPMPQPTGSLGMGTIFHKGVRCDGCGVLPITGPRFKSKVKHDYDLCSICYSRMGNDVDYTRFDLPLANVHPWSFRVPDTSFRQGMMRPHASQHISKLDSRFIMDVNVMDGATMAPLTPFTKIWRMRNNGTRPWTRGLQLLCIEGDRFSRSNSVEIQVPSGSVNVGQELDIAVDFIAPELPGRYISFWRMADSSSQVFGQRVWVQIQVDPSVDLTRENSPRLNLNLPPNTNETTFSELVDVKAEPDFSVDVGESSAPSVPKDNHNIEMVSHNFPTDDDFLATPNVAGSSSATSLSPSSVPPPAASANVAVSFSQPPSDLVSDDGIFFYPRQARPFPLAAPSWTSYFKSGTQSYPLQEASAPFLPYPAISTLGESSIDASNVQADYGNSNLEKSSEKASSPVSASAASVCMPLSSMRPRSSMRDIFPTRLLEASAPLPPYPIIPTPRESLPSASVVKNASSEIASPSITPPVVSANKPVSSARPSSVSYPEVATYPVHGTLRELSPGASNLQNDNGNQEQASEKAKFEETLLRELAQMGFNEVDLNLEVLRINEYDMERAVEDLCDVSEWDPMLKELSEMGFNDKEMNKKLLAKNSGSITRVVMDLIAEETP